jgi:hypothetical protein
MEPIIAPADKYLAIFSLQPEILRLRSLEASIVPYPEPD